MHHALSQSARTWCLIFGLVQLAGAIFWCFGGAGIYGSPFALISGEELTRVVAFLITGPLFAFLSSLVVLWRPRRGAIQLVAGGLLSGALVLFSPGWDVRFILLAIVSVPMLLLGLWLLRATAIQKTKGESSEHPSQLHGENDVRGSVWVIVRGVLFFLFAVVGTYALFIVLAMNNVTGLRGPIRADNPFLNENQDWADGVVVMLLALAVTAITCFRKPMRLRVEPVAGMWLGVLLAGLMILVR